MTIDRRSATFPGYHLYYASRRASPALTLGVQALRPAIVSRGPSSRIDVGARGAPQTPPASLRGECDDMFRHDVQFYERDAFLIETVLDFVTPAMTSGGAAVIIATRAHLDLLQAEPAVSAWCRPRGEADNLVLLEASDVLKIFMVDDLPDETRFFEVVGGLMQRVSEQGRRHVSAFGEMVAVLYEEGNAEAALQLERLWELLSKRHAFSLLCAYPLSAFPSTDHRRAFECLCAAHTGVQAIEPYAAARPEALHRAIALLRQQANSLEVELRRRDDYERALAEQSARITTMRFAQADLESVVDHDALTGLFNRRVFDDRLAHAIVRASRTQSSFALIYLDLDDFKAINDGLGHRIGDELLKQVGARLRTCVRTADTVCRWGGDEFAIIMEAADASHAAVLVDRIEAAMSEPFVLDKTAIDVSASVGLSLYPTDATDADALVQSADAAMYRAKRGAKIGRAVHADAHALAGRRSSSA